MVSSNQPRERYCRTIWSRRVSSGSFRTALAAALFSTYHVVDGQRVVDEWLPVRGW
jgi:hypothetical protein